MTQKYDLYGAIQNQKQNRNPLAQLNIDANEQCFQSRCFRKIDYDEKNYKLALLQERIKKSIFTENQDIGQIHTLETCYEQDDICNFIQRNKSLKEKIEQRLKNKNKKKKLNQVEQTTFRPQIKKVLGTKVIENSKISQRKNLATSKSAIKTKHMPSHRLKTQNILWWEASNEGTPKNRLTQMSFFERQNLGEKKKKELSKKIKEEKMNKQISQCTFKPKLTKYRPTI